MISKNLMKKILKKAGAERTSKKAQIKLAKLIEDYALKVSRLAVSKAGYFGRKTVKAEDL